MKIGILGAGKIGATAAQLFVEAGHEVAVSNSRGPESLADLVATLGPRARAATLADAARFGEIVLLAVPWHREDATPPPDLLRDKVVIDAMNPYRPEGGFFDLGGSTSSEEVLKRIRGAKLVKAFNTIYYEHLATRGRKDLPVEERHAIYLAGDNRQAKQVVAKLIEDIGFAPVDTGSLRGGGRLQEPDSPIYNQTFTAREARGFFRNQMHKLVDSLPDGALPLSLETLRLYQTWPPSLERPKQELEQIRAKMVEHYKKFAKGRASSGGFGGGFTSSGSTDRESSGSHTMSTWEGDTRVTLGLIYYHGFPLETTERIRFSDDKKRLAYSHEIKGPKGDPVKHQDEFEV